MKPGALLVQIKVTYIQLIIGTDLCVTEISFFFNIIWGI